MAACRTGDTLVVAKLDRFARSVTDARDIVDELTARGVRLNPGGSLHDPTDPIGRLLFTVLAECQEDLARARTREGMAVAKARADCAVSSPSSARKQETHLVELWRAGKHTTLELVELLNVAAQVLADLVADEARPRRWRVSYAMSGSPRPAQGDAQT
jgi:DNA invertase Pin-like site-specific DNA recombinase